MAQRPIALAIPSRTSLTTSPVVPENAGTARARSEGGGTVTPRAVRFDAAPELTIGGNRIMLDGLRYNVALDLKDQKGRRVTGDLSIAGAADQLMPPIQIHGAGGWR